MTYKYINILLYNIQPYNYILGFYKLSISTRMNMHMKNILIFFTFFRIIQSVPDTTICTIGFTVSSPSFCSASFGPCATSNFDGTIPTYATRCLTCFNDAQLLQIGSSHTCIPIACTSVAGGNVCGSCQNGYALTINKSCILNFVSSANNYNSTNSSVLNTSDLITPSLILSATAIICVILYFILKWMERCKCKKDQTVNPQAILPQIKDPIKNRNITEFQNSLVFVESRNQTGN